MGTTDKGPTKRWKDGWTPIEKHQQIKLRVVFIVALRILDLALRNN